MRFSGRFRLIAAAALALTLGVKAAWTRELPPPDRDLFGAHGFEIRRRVHAAGIITYGRRGRCRLMVAEYDPEGTFADLLTVFARPVGPLHYAWRGALGDAPPRLLPLSEHLLRRQLQRFGASPSRHPITAVAASAACAPERIGWDGLAMLPR